MNVYERIKMLCKEKEMPISKLEKELGFSNGYIGKLDKSNPNVANLQKIAIYFDVSLDWLMGMEKEPETNQMPIEEARLIAQNMNNARELEKEKIKDAIDYYTDPATAEMMQKLFESPGRRALFNAVADMDEESVQKYADFIERITHDNNKSN